MNGLTLKSILIIIAVALTSTSIAAESNTTHGAKFGCMSCHLGETAPLKKKPAHQRPNPSKPAQLKSSPFSPK
jgi:hypothetical protein